MGKTRNLFKKIGGIQGTFHTRMGMIKDGNGKDLKEAEEIKKRWQEYTKNYTKKVLMTWITAMVWSLNSSQASWIIKSSGLREHQYKQS